jgi:hypothetical protein
MRLQEKPLYQHKPPPTVVGEKTTWQEVQLADLVAREATRRTSQGLLVYPALQGHALYSLLEDASEVLNLLHNYPLFLMQQILSSTALSAFFEQWKDRLWQILLDSAVRRAVDRDDTHIYPFLVAQYNQTRQQWGTLMPPQSQLADLWNEQLTRDTSFANFVQIVRGFWEGRQVGGALSSIALGSDETFQVHAEPLEDHTVVFYNPLLRLFVHCVTRLLFVWGTQTVEHTKVRRELQSVLASVLRVDRPTTLYFYSDLMLVARRGAVPFMQTDRQQTLSKQAQLIRQYADKATQRWKDGRLDRTALDLLLADVASLEQYIRFYVAGNQSPALYTALEFQPLREMQLSLWRQQLFGERGLYSSSSKQRLLLQKELERIGQDKRNPVSLQLYYEAALKRCASCRRPEPEHVDQLLALAFCDDQCCQKHYETHNIQANQLIQCAQ